MAGTEEWEEVFVEANGITFHCVVQGSGDLVLLLHGFPEYWYSWRHQIPFLARRFRVVAPDMRGYNLSDKPEGVHNYDSSILVEDVRALIEAFDARSARLVAHDWGGAVAWMFALAHPELLDKLVVAFRLGRAQPVPCAMPVELLLDPFQEGSCLSYVPGIKRYRL